MEIGIKEISRVTIKPYSPTPKSLQKHHLSFIDQIMPPIYSSCVYFYTSNPTIPNSQKSSQLKKSLSEVLSIFYPLAGRLIGNSYVECNDSGAAFADAEADCHLSLVISDPNPKYMGKLLPYETGRPQDFCMAVQATHFTCGGLAIGILISHRISDALSLFSFANAWSAVLRNGGGALPPPKFDASAYFPPLDMAGFHLGTGMAAEELAICRIFIFSAATISALQETYSAGGRRPSRVEALSAFVWTRFMSAAGLTCDPGKICTARFAVNLRTRAEPPLSERLFGNILAPAVARPAAGDDGIEFLQKMREAMKAIDSSHVARMKNSEKHMEELRAQANQGEGEPVCFDFTSVCGFPLYQANFGWGRPVQVGVGPAHHKNLAIFMDTESGGGIEALVYLTKQHMQVFENDLKMQLLKSNL